MRRVPVHLGRAALVCLFLVGCSGIGRLTGGPASDWLAEPMPAWEDAFRHADDRWRGADGSYSVPLSASSTLWLFGDTWITPAGAEGREAGRVIRNSLAIQAVETGKPGEIEFFWEEEADGPRAPFVPPQGPGWLWPLSGERVGDSLYVFFGQFVGNDSRLGFEASGSWLFRIDNPEEDPEGWNMRPSRVPFFEHTRKGDQFFGVACMETGGFLYVYGVREDWTRGVTGRSVLVARTPLESLEEADFSTWRFFSGDVWSEDWRRSGALFDGAATEMSVSFLPGGNRFLAVYSYCGLSEEILARLSRRPEGPWGKPVILYRCPETTWSENYFCYAGKAHPELAQGGDEVVITYAVNSWELEDHLKDLRIYWPRFVRMLRR
jgi:hypothetical protein